MALHANQRSISRQLPHKVAKISRRVLALQRRRNKTFLAACLVLFATAAISFRSENDDVRSFYSAEQLATTTRTSAGRDGPTTTRTSSLSWMRLRRNQHRQLDVHPFCYTNMIQNGDFETLSVSPWIRSTDAIAPLDIQTYGLDLTDHALRSSDRTSPYNGPIQDLAHATSCLSGTATDFYLHLQAKVRLFDQATNVGIENCVNDVLITGGRFARYNCPFFKLWTHKFGAPNAVVVEVHETNYAWDPNGWNVVDVIFEVTDAQTGDDVTHITFAAFGGPPWSVLLLDDVVLTRVDAANVPGGHPIYQFPETDCSDNIFVNGDAEYQSPWHWDAYGGWSGQVSMDVVEISGNYVLRAEDRTLPLHQGLGQLIVGEPLHCFVGSNYYLRIEADVQLYDQATGAGINTCAPTYAETTLNCPFVQIDTYIATTADYDKYQHYDNQMMASWNGATWNRIDMIFAMAPGTDPGYDHLRINIMGGPDGSAMLLDNVRARRLTYGELPAGHEILALDGGTMPVVKMCRAYADPHFKNFCDVSFDNHDPGWQLLYEYNDLKIEQDHEEYVPAWDGGFVKIIRAVRITYKGTVYEYAHGVVPTESNSNPHFVEDKLLFADPPVKVVIRVTEFTIDNDDRLLYNVFLTTSVTSEDQGVNGLCTCGDVPPVDARADIVFHADAPSQEEAEAACANLQGLPEFQDCVTDYRMTSDPVARDVLVQTSVGVAEEERLLQEEIEQEAATALMPEAEEAAVMGDPLIVGLRNQVFKFDGRSDAWYANVASDSLQWNMKFHQFPDCASDQDVFVTSIGIGIYSCHKYGTFIPRAIKRRLVGQRLAHTVAVSVKDEASFFPGCQGSNSTCLGDGSLEIIIDGQVISMPGDYMSSDSGLRVIAHNTYGACSRRWHDMSEADENKATGNRLLSPEKTPIDFLMEARGAMVNPEECTPWIKERARKGDLFSQAGTWATILIEAPSVSFHVEYRQNNNKKGSCLSHSIDAWISRVSPELRAEEWRGVLGETRQVTHALQESHNDGMYIQMKRSDALSGKDDSDYEVSGPYATEFNARRNQRRRSRVLGRFGLGNA